METTQLSAATVAEYLREHPDFFVRHPSLLEQLSVPASEQGVVSLVHIQLQRQRERIVLLEEEITTLMTLAADNDRTFHDFMQLQEQILRSSTLMEVCRAIENKALEMNLSAYIRLIDCDNSQYALTHESYQRFMTNHLNGKSAYLGRMKKADRAALLGCRDTPEMGSYVVLPLSAESSQGVLAFSSIDGGHFQPHMDTLFLRHLAQVFSYLLDILPWTDDSYE